jgi:hypothetical protein
MTSKAILLGYSLLEEINSMEDTLREIHDLIHPDTTPDGNDTSDGEILDMIFELVKERLGM